MKTLALLLLSAVFMVLPVFAADQRGGTWFISLPTKDVEEVRALMMDPVKGTDVTLFAETLRKRPGVEIVSQWWLFPRWDDQAGRSMGFHRSKIGRKPEREAEAWINYHHKAEHGLALQSVGCVCEVPTKADGTEYMSFSGDSGFVPVHEGHWLEMATWQQGETTWMMWQRFPEVDPQIPQAPGTSEDPLVKADTQLEAEAQVALTVDLLFFKATPAAIGQLAKSGPDTREKAAQWLMARGPAWRAMRIRQQVGGIRRWTFSEEKLGMVGKAEEVIFKNALNLELTGKRADDVLSLDLVINRTEGNIGAPWFAEKRLLETVTPGWNFILLEKCGEVNALVYREVKH